MGAKDIFALRTRHLSGLNILFKASLIEQISQCSEVKPLANIYIICVCVCVCAYTHHDNQNNNKLHCVSRWGLEPHSNLHLSLTEEHNSRDVSVQGSFDLRLYSPSSALLMLGARRLIVHHYREHQQHAGQEFHQILTPS